MVGAPHLGGGGVIRPCPSRSKNRWWSTGYVRFLWRDGGGGGLVGDRLDFGYRFGMELG